MHTARSQPSPTCAHGHLLCPLLVCIPCNPLTPPASLPLPAVEERSFEGSSRHLALLFAVAYCTWLLVVRQRFGKVSASCCCCCCWKTAVAGRLLQAASCWQGVRALLLLLGLLLLHVICSVMGPDPARMCDSMRAPTHMLLAPSI